MEKEIRKMMQISSIVSGVLSAVTIIVSFGLLKIYSVPYRRIIAYVVAGVSLLLILLWAVSLALARANRSGSAEGFSIYLLRAGISIMLPAYIYLAGLFREDKDELRRVYINVNNIAARYRLRKNHSARMLMLIPHCMQNKDCRRSITEDISNCKKCGCCRIGEIAGIAENCGIRTVVAKGGTAARNTVKECKPDFIFAIACERELISGIGDVGKIPVIGLINQRPNGYCTNTTVDIQQLKKTLQELETRYDIRDSGFEDLSEVFEGLSESTRHETRDAGQKIV